MRLFVAVWPSPAALVDLAAAVAAVPVPPGLRPIDPGRWHVTLAFLGEVDDTTASQLRPRLARVAGRSRGGDAQLADAGRFGSSVVWVGVTGDVAALRQLAQRSAAAARRSGVPLEDRPFRAHLTVARGRTGTDLRPWVDALASYTGPTWSVDRLTLVHSTLGAHPSYEPIASWPLLTSG